MKTITKKCQLPYFEQILSGAKRFEIRLNDVDYQVGDTLELREWIEAQVKQYSQYTGRAVACRITTLVSLTTSTLTRVFIDGHEWWTPEEIEEHGMVIIGIEVIK